MVASYNLNTFLSGHVFAFLMLLSRIGGVIMLFPGVGESYVPPRSRLTFACAICLLLLEPMMPRMPAMPTAPAEMARLVSYEIIIGLFFGTLVRLIMGVLEDTGFVIGVQTGLSNATILNPLLATQSPLPAALLSIAGLVLLFTTGMDHFLIRSMVALYDLFPPGGAWMPGDMAQTVIHVTNQSFMVGIELAAPFLVVGLLLYVGVGVVQRMLPSVQLFLITLPLEIWGGLFLMALTIAGILTVWLHYFDSAVGAFFVR